MTLEHKIRICVSHLKGKEREAQILRLLQEPDLIRKTLAFKLEKIKSN